MSLNLDKVLVINFAVNERTTELSELCIKKLGFDNVVTLKSDDGFRSKFIRSAQLAKDSDAECFLRSDADRLLFEGTLQMVKAWQENPETMVVEGKCFDFLMNKYRGATPHLFSRKALEMLNDDPSLMPDTQKPESRFIENITENKIRGWKSMDVLTNLHDYEQYPSKVCNTIINRISRGHFGYLYDMDYVATLDTKYQTAFSAALGYVKSCGIKEKMDYVDFPLLDRNVLPMMESSFEEKFLYYQTLYESLK